MLRSARLALVMFRFFWLLMLATSVGPLRSRGPGKASNQRLPVPTTYTERPELREAEVRPVAARSGAGMVRAAGMVGSARRSERAAALVAVVAVVGAVGLGLSGPAFGQPVRPSGATARGEGVLPAARSARPHRRPTLGDRPDQLDRPGRHRPIHEHGPVDECRPVDRPVHEHGNVDERGAVDRAADRPADRADHRPADRALDERRAHEQRRTLQHGRHVDDHRDHPAGRRRQAGQDQPAGAGPRHPQQPPGP